LPRQTGNVIIRAIARLSVNEPGVAIIRRNMPQDRENKPASTPSAPFFAVFDSKPSSSYKGITIKADELLHVQAAALLMEHCGRGAKVIDLGAGAGAFSQRMADAGLDVEAVDISKDEFRATGAGFTQLDLDDDRAVAQFLEERRGKLDAVVSLEVVEHLKDVWALASFAAALLRPGGVLMLSTPNIASWHSRMLFLFRGRFHQFEDGDLAYGHIHPAHPEMLKLAARDAGLEVLSVSPAGYLPKLWLTTGPRMAIQNVIGFMLRPFMRGIKDGWCVLFLARKPS